MKHCNCGVDMEQTQSFIKDYQSILQSIFKGTIHMSEEDLTWYKSFIRDALRDDERWLRYLSKSHRKYCLGQAHINLTHYESI